MAKENDKNTVQDYSKAEKALRAEGPGRLYLLYGEEEYLRDSYRTALHTLCLDGSEEEFNYRRMDADAFSVTALGEAVNAMPFFAGHTLVEVIDCDLNRLRESESAALKDLLADIPEYCTLVFVEPASFAPDNRKAVIKQLAKSGRCMAFPRQEEAVLVRWIKRRFEKAGKQISDADASYLTDLVGPLMNRLTLEIDKVSSGITGGTVRRADLDAMVTRIPESQVYSLADYLLAGNSDAAVHLLADLYTQQEEPIMILAYLGTKLRQIYALRLALDARLGREEQKSVTGLRFDRHLDAAAAQARRLSRARLGRLVTLCAEADYAMKSSGRPAQEILLETCLRMAQTEAAK